MHLRSIFRRVKILHTVLHTNKERKASLVYFGEWFHFTDQLA